MQKTQKTVNSSGGPDGRLDDGPDGRFDDKFDDKPN
jgi:hypothetical protein